MPKWRKTLSQLGCLILVRALGIFSTNAERWFLTSSASSASVVASCEVCVCSSDGLHFIVRIPLVRAGHSVKLDAECRRGNLHDLAFLFSCHGVVLLPGLYLHQIAHAINSRRRFAHFNYSKKWNQKSRWLLPGVRMRSNPSVHADACGAGDFCVRRIILLRAQLYRIYSQTQLFQFLKNPLY